MTFCVLFLCSELRSILCNGNSIVFWRGRNGERRGRPAIALGVCAAERADYCCETLHALIVDTMTQVINGLIPARHTQCAKIANIPDIRNPRPTTPPPTRPPLVTPHGGQLHAD
ncbi:hypothetical protein MTP99_015601 [Tenebrio molitor]|jgi:hypothetical protein|nr:hypothetical protein MTP99_015601 [Tenebrio molitor]